MIRREESILNFYCGNKRVYEQTYFRKFSKNTERGYGVEIIIPLDNIKEFYEMMLIKYKKNIVEPLKVRFDKLDFRMVDPFGFYLRFVERYDWVNNRDQTGKSIHKK